MEARYVFEIRFRIDPATAGVSVEPREFETRLFRTAEEPGTDGWLFFRDNLWRGDLADEDHFRTLTEDALGVPVVSASYRAFEVDEAYLETMRTAIADSLEQFNAETVDEVLSKYLGSSIEVERG